MEKLTWEEMFIDKLEELIKSIIEDNPTHESIGNCLDISKIKNELIVMLNDCEPEE